jgi:signal peptide peptidase SppA, 67K type
MKDFFKMLFASVMGVIIASVILIFISMFMFAGILASATSAPAFSLEKNTVLTLDLSGVVNERETVNPMDYLFGPLTQNTGLDDITNAIKKAKENDKIKGIYIKAGAFSSGIASLEAIRNALLDFKESGKFIVAYGDYYTQGTYYIAALADKVIMNPQGMLDLHGLANNTEFYKGALDKLGVKMQVFKVGTYKSYVEPFIQEKMSDANKEQVTAFLDDIWNHLLGGISTSRNISIDKLNTYADEVIAFSDPRTIVEYQLVDTLMYSKDVTEYLKELTGTEAEKDIKQAKVKDMKTVPFLNPSKSKNKIAILYAEGSIVGDEAQNPYSPNVITAKEYVKELMKLKKDEDVKAIVFRVNSGGGSAFASEQIWNAVKEVKQEKPIIVSMGDYAASGGYYISCAADQIVAEPTTLTGSIGIFGLIPEGEELSKKMGLSYDGVKTNKHSDLGASGIPLIGIPIKPFTEEENKIFQAYIERGYDLFISRCADGRSKTKAEIDSIGQGRVWTGAQAYQLGLVDKIGGLDDAVLLAAEKANVSDYKTVNYPARKDFFTQLLEESLGTVQVRAKKQVLGSDKYEQLQLLENLKSFDYRMAVMPYHIKN